MAERRERLRLARETGKPFGVESEDPSTGGECHPVTAQAGATGFVTHPIC
jgi:hypothetical protein